MNKIECGFCHKTSLFTDDNITSAGKDKFIRCKKCGRSIFVQHKEERYYEVIDDESER